jgi:5-methylcytosine-specific restriction endonuclease McrA
MKIVKTGTDGWYVNLGQTSPYRMLIQLWFDRYPGTESRRFYYGFYASSRTKANIRSLMRRLPRHLKSIRTLKNDDYEKKSQHVWLLCKPMRRNEFNRPIFEHYIFSKSDHHLFYGQYVFTQKITDNNMSRMVNHAANFFSECMWLLPEGSNVKEKTTVYPQLERSVVRRHLIRERSPDLAKACKRRDGYRCKVCKMTFAEVYGEELGAEFAEAHHLYPLSKKRAKEKTRLDDLVTVCSNCHRMLHQMRGREHDLDELKRVIQIQKREKRK